MAGITVYGTPGSPYLRSAMLALEEKGAAYEFVRIPFGDNRKPEYRKRHPFGRIPAFEHDGFQLYETQAILRYLDAIFPQPPLQPADPHKAARMNQLAGILDWYFFPQVSATISFQRLIVPQIGGGTPNEDIIAAARPNAAICVAEIERLMAPAPYLTGDALSIADLMLAPHLAYFAMTPEGAEALSRHVRLKDWLGRMEERDSMKRTAPPVR